MANYVYHQLKCSQEFLHKYLLDNRPLNCNQKLDAPYITFNRLMGVRSLNEYYQKFGEYIYYGFGFSYEKLATGDILVKFATKRDAPFAAIQQALTHDHTVEWLMAYECCDYVSHFYWEDGVQESKICLNDDFIEWTYSQVDLEEKLTDNDHIVWYFLQQ